MGLGERWPQSNPLRLMACSSANQPVSCSSSRNWPRQPTRLDAGHRRDRDGGEPRLASSGFPLIMNQGVKTMLTGHIPELLLVLVLALVVFGPKRLPEIGSSLGKGIR